MPVTIWIVKHNPRSEPKFHIYLKFDGAGRSTSDELMGANTWLNLRIGVGIEESKVQCQWENFGSLVGRAGKHDGWWDWSIMDCLNKITKINVGIISQKRGAI